MNRVVKIENQALVFDDGSVLGTFHATECSEDHWLSFDDLSIADFEGLEFDLSGDTFFRRIPDYGIELIPIVGWGVKIPGYSDNNGYYSNDLDLVLKRPSAEDKIWDITDCQPATISEYTYKKMVRET